MVELTEQLRRLTDRYVYLHLEVIGNVDHLHEEHRQILAAVHRGDAREVADLTRVHLETSHDFILRYLLRTASADDRSPTARRAERRSRPGHGSAFQPCGLGAMPQSRCADARQR